MIRITNILAVVALISLPTLAIEGVQILRQPSKREKIKIEIKPAQEVSNRFQNVALAPICPRETDTTPEIPSSTVDGSVEHEHCPHCRMGVFFRRSEDKISCSYCEIEKQG